MPTMVDRTKISQTCVEVLHEKYGEILFATSINRAIESANSAKNKTPLCLSSGKLSAEYENLTQEGIDIRLITEEKAEIISRLKIKNIHFAWDRYSEKAISVNCKDGLIIV